MAKTLIANNANGQLGGGINGLTFTGSTQALGMYLVNTPNKTRLLAMNGDASTKTVTIVSVADEYGRTGDIALVVPAAVGGVPGIGYAGPFDPTMFGQGGANTGQIYVNTSADTSLSLAAVTDP